MEYLVWIGALVTLAGLALVIWCILSVLKARKTGDDAAVRARLQAVMPVNLGALFLSALGLMMVVVGLFLG